MTVTTDLKCLLDKASLDLPVKVSDKKLKFHLVNAFPDKVAIKLILLPLQMYAQTISKATELLLIYQHVDRADASIQLITNNERLCKLEAS